MAAMTHVSEAQLRSTADSVIAAIAGPGAAVREDQLAAAHALVVERRRALVVQATGWGKSAVYWIAARAIRDAGGGPTLVVSPLLALMGDQVSAAARAGLRAATLNSGNLDDWSAIESQVLAGEIDVLLVSPERLANPRFASGVLSRILPTLGLLVIDEAHCISSWGHDFRPDYQRIARLLGANPGLPVLATTATANSRVTADVAEQLGPDTLVQRGRLARESLHLGVNAGLTPLGRFAWADTALRELPGSGIVYCLTVADAERLAAFLVSRGHAVAAYTGQTETADRARIEAELRDNRLKAVVATSALGMGYDKPDLAFCLHVGSPASPVDYYQQVGRAGRALDTAAVVLLPGETDARLWEWFATASVPDPRESRLVLDALDAATHESPDGVLSVPALETATGVRRSKVELLVKVLAVDGAVERVEGGFRSTGVPWTYDHEKYAGIVAARRAEAELMRSYAMGRDCLEAILRRSLDDPVEPGERCGRCSVCTGTLPGALDRAASAESLGAARAFLRGLDVELEPRKMWTAGIAGAAGRDDWKGRISSGLAGLPGRALAFADDPAWEEMGAVTGPGVADAEAPAWALEGLAALLARWVPTMGQPPAAVVPVPSAGRPRLVTSLADAVGAHLGVRVVHALEAVGPAPDPTLSAAARARALAPRFRLRAGYTVPDVPVLLVDDTWRSGWTATFATAVLRDAGARSVTPLVLHQLP
jgi:ATP-dependent DNA helicase RecQ